MAIKTIDAAAVQRAFLTAASRLEEKKEWINELNVFPVPDGDTGTNMSLTIMSAAKEVAALQKPDIKSLSKAISSGSLRGARGNSGVILSQLLRGFTKEIQDSKEIDVTVLANAMVRGTETAYKAVMKPKEGTILTVAKGISDKAMELAAQTDDLQEMIREIIKYGDYVLSQTPEMLPVLKEAGVVDSGGQGLMEAIRGAYKGLTGEMPKIDVFSQEKEASDGQPKGALAGNTSRKKVLGRGDIETADIKFGYCTEFLINLEKGFPPEEERAFKAYLESIGDSLVVVADDEIVKVHVHTNHPGLAFEKGLAYGSLSRMKVDNMREEHEERLIQDAQNLARIQKEEGQEHTVPRKKYGVIAVSCGKGLEEILKGIGADYLIEGGQTMNPSTEDVLEAIRQVNADHIFILPNNGNIIMAARQAADLTDDKQVTVIPSKTVPQGIAALVNLMPDQSVEENVEVMTREMENVKTAQITYAVRNTNVDGVEIKEGDIMAVGDRGILAVEKNAAAASLKALEAMIDENSELVSIYYGNGVTREQAEDLTDMARERYPQVEYELQEGGQPVYYYLLSVE